MDLGSSREAASGMCGLIALIVVGEVGGEEIGVVGILCLDETLENCAHDVQPRTPRRDRTVGTCVGIQACGSRDCSHQRGPGTLSARTVSLRDKVATGMRHTAA
jgi:hypothetical protein